jgi:hypothetical protein
VRTVVLCGALVAGLLSGQTAFGQQAAPTARPSLDFEFFKTKVQPIFLAKRPGHARCVSCHAGSTAPAVLRLEPLPAGSKTWDEGASRQNFVAVKLVVIAGNVKSPLLVHPLAQDAGGDFFHSGGKHFNSQNDPEWLILKAWVMGQTLSASK